MSELGRSDDIMAMVESPVGICVEDGRQTGIPVDNARQGAKSPKP